MKVRPTFLLFFLTIQVKAEQVTYVGSTPANSTVVREFLAIPSLDSLDFIRWKIILQEDQFSLKCNYGISKPNTNGFIQGGTWIEVHGMLRKQNHYYFLESKNKILGLLKLNNSLLHLLSADKTLLVGNGGWSYTLNRDKGKSSPANVNLLSGHILLKDSMAFQGRTPCGNFAIVHSSPQCLKRKWLLILYTDPKTKEPATYYLNPNNRGEGGTKGKWKMTTKKDGKVSFQLFPDTGGAPLELLILDENVLAFTDSTGCLLVGNDDFSYTLSRKW